MGSVLALNACSRNAGLVVAIDSNMSVPENISEVAIVLTDDAGNAFYANSFRPGSSGKISLPAQLGVAPANSAVHFALVGFQGASPKIFREAIGRSPDDVLATLQMSLDWEDWGSAELVSPSAQAPAADAGTIGDGGAVVPAYLPGMALQGGEGSEQHTTISVNGKTIRNACVRGQTSIGGRCVDANFDAAKLPAYSEALVYGGDKRQCFPRLACFHKGLRTMEMEPPASLDAAGNCVIPRAAIPKYFGESFNVGVRVKEDGRIFPINRKTAGFEGGWSLEGDVIIAPRALCMGSAFGNEGKVVKPASLVISSLCESKTRQYPLCENSATVTAPMGGCGDNSAPNDKGGCDPVVVTPDPTDASAPDGGPGPDASTAPKVAPFVEVPNPSDPNGFWVPTAAAATTLQAVDLVSASSTEDKLAIAMTTQSGTPVVYKAYAGILDRTSTASVLRAGDPTTLARIGSTGTPAPAWLSGAKDTAALITVDTNNTSNTGVRTLNADGAPINVAGCWGTLRTATVQSDGHVVCVLADALGPGLDQWTVSPQSSPNILRGSFDLSGGLGAIGAESGCTTTNGVTSCSGVSPGFWLNAAGFRVFGSNVLPATVTAGFFSSLAPTPNDTASAVGMSVTAPATGVEEVLVLVKHYNVTQGARWSLYRKALNGDALPTLVADSLRLDSVQETFNKVVPSTHPYAVVGRKLYYLSTVATVPKLMRVNLDAPAQAEALNLKLPTDTAFGKVYALAATRAINSANGPVHRVYVAASSVAAGTPGFKLYAADLEP